MRSSGYSRPVGCELGIVDVLVGAAVVVAAVVGVGVDRLYVHSGFVRSDPAVRLRDFEQNFARVRMTADDEREGTVGIGVRMPDLAEIHQPGGHQTAGPQDGYVGPGRVKEAD